MNYTTGRTTDGTGTDHGPLVGVTPATPPVPTGGRSASSCPRHSELDDT
jgi:hypothetical protein